VQGILDGMAWLQLGYEEGPFYQTKRFDRYKEVIEQMLAAGMAYRCYCSKERLEQLRTQQTENKEKPRYDGLCRERTDIGEGSYVVRFKNPSAGVVEFDDLVRGKLTFANTELDDLIIARSDSTPTYNFTVVVDDWDMQITHVIRGDDHINNTPRQINILRALGATPPLYAHVPMILGSDGKRLSKRHGAVSVLQYREDGFLADALINYLVRLGWSHGDQEIFSRAELINYFAITDINRAPAAFNLDKLLWLNQHYMKTSDPTVVAQELAWQMQQLGVDTSNGPALADIVRVQAERTKTLREMAERSRYFYEEVVISAEMQTHFTAELMPALKIVSACLSNANEWSKEAIHAILAETAEKSGMKLGKLAQPIRVAMTGGTVSPPLDSTILLLGREKAVTRLQNAIASC
jgi:glutamyl-tRNA synthetase